MKKSNSPLDNLISQLGKKIRTIRTAKKIPLRELSSRTNLSIAALSQIETGVMKPSLSSMLFIAYALNIPMGDFFVSKEADLNSDEMAFLQKKGDEKLLHWSENGHIYLLYHNEILNVEIVKNVFQALGTTGDKKIQHEGSEWGMVLKGRLKVELNDQEYIMNEGDSIHFRSTIPHRLVNIDNDITIQIWMNSPALWVSKRV